MKTFFFFYLAGTNLALFSRKITWLTLVNESPPLRGKHCCSCPHCFLLGQCLIPRICAVNPPQSLLFSENSPFLAGWGSCYWLLTSTAKKCCCSLLSVVVQICPMVGTLLPPCSHPALDGELIQFFWVALGDTAHLGDAEQDLCPVLGLAPTAPQPLAEASRVCCGETRCWGSRGSLCLLRGPRRSCILGSREWEAKEEAESDLKEPSGIYLPAHAARGCWGASSAAAAVWMAFAAFKSKGGGRNKSMETCFA